MTVYQQRLNDLAATPRVWTVTGVAGFIGSNLLQRLLDTGQQVVGLDNLATGSKRNLEEVEAKVGPERWRNFRFLHGDIRDAAKSREACHGADYVLHQAALGSVPLSLERPDETHAVNVSGFLNVLLAARDAKVRRFVFASSCAVYGDDADSPKVEERLGQAISPYATSKRINELYAEVFNRCYGLSTIGLRYFNIYGPRQDPNGAYAAVIPKWISAFRHRNPISIYGDGKTSRDFCFVEDVVQANILAATGDLAGGTQSGGLVCNVGTGTETSLNELFATLSELIAGDMPDGEPVKPNYEEFRPGDIRHSRADISRARRSLGFSPAFALKTGLAESLHWYAEQHKGARAA